MPVIKPNFICVGAAKSGTTWLHHCLNEHPDVFVPNIKELRFFSVSDHYQKGVDWYESFFEQASNVTAIGEVTPSYMYSPEVPERIYHYNPEIQLLFILRNPVERAYSHYCMAMRAGIVDKNIDVGLSLQSTYVEWGCYFSQISNFLNFFSQDQIKIMLFDHLRHDPSLISKEMFKFIGVNSEFVPSNINTQHNVSKALPRNPTIHKFLRESYLQIIHRSELLRYHLEPLRVNGQLNILNFLTHSRKIPRMSAAKKCMLASFYTEEVKELSKLVNKDLYSIWIKPYLQ